MSTRGYIVGSIIIFAGFLVLTFAAASLAIRHADQNQNRIDSAFSILEAK